MKVVTVKRSEKLLSMKRKFKNIQFNCDKFNNIKDMVDASTFGDKTHPIVTSLLGSDQVVPENCTQTFKHYGSVYKHLFFIHKKYDARNTYFYNDPLYGFWCKSCHFLKEENHACKHLFKCEFENPSYKNFNDVAGKRLNYPGMV